MKKYSLLLVHVLLVSSSFSQESDRQIAADIIIQNPVNRDSIKTVNKRFAKTLIIPAVFIGYGALTLGNHSLRLVNDNFKKELQRSSPSFHSRMDNFMQYSPAVAVYALNAVGIKGQHDFFDRTAILTLSALLEQSTVRLLKTATHQLRPDESNFRSFPSGHTSNAFAAAEFLHQEYKHISPWYRVAGYVVAAGTGGFRMYNNKHWFSDVITGAGIGILSTKLVYRAYPWISDHIFKRKNPKLLALPSYHNGSVGFAMVYRFAPSRDDQDR
ncbi:MAG: phosphatase PAP2 family protein [Chitinophagaceae bacterium]